MITAYIDDGASGNPGPAGYGVYIQGIGDVTFEDVRRQLNTDADRLSNLGMDEAEAQLTQPKYLDT